MSDNQEVVHESGVSRLLNSIICAVCIAPILVIISVFLLGFNERRAVCEARAFAAGEEAVKQVGCNGAASANGELVLFSCDLSREGLENLTFTGTDFEDVLGFQGTGLQAVSEMYQCVETESSETTKDSVGGGKTTVKTYTYSKEWRSSRVDSGAFAKKGSQSFQDNCGTENPEWPVEVPRSQTKYAAEVRTGDFVIRSPLVSQVPLTARVLASSPPADWTLSAGRYESNKWEEANGIGAVRVSFKGTDWSSPKVTVLGENTLVDGEGFIGAWTAPDSWMCSGVQLGSLISGVASKSQFFDSLESGSHAITVLLRLLGFLLIWFALSRLAGPLEVAADCIPCVGPFLGDSIAAIACCVTCPPACACALGVIGVVWVFMRPLVGIPLMLIFLVTVGAYAYFVSQQREKKRAAAEAQTQEAQQEA